VRLLLDTQVLLWWVQGSDRLGGKGRRLVADGKNELLWSAASTWELAIKLQIGKLRLEESLEAFLARVIPAQGLTPCRCSMRTRRALPCCRRTTRTRSTASWSRRQTWKACRC